jgi:hypothetical protein
MAIWDWVAWVGLGVWGVSLGIEWYRARAVPNVQMF